MSRKMTRDQEKAMFARMNEGCAPKRNRSTKNRTKSTSRDIKTSEIKTSKYWEGNPEGHSEAAKLGWEMRKIGYSKIPSSQLKQHKGEISRYVKIEPYKGTFETMRVISVTQEPNNTHIINDITYIVQKHKGQNRYAIYNTKSEKVHGPFKSEKEAKKMVFIYAMLEG